MASIFKDAVAQEINDQPVWLRYKASLIILASGIVSIIAQLATSPDFAGTQVATILTTVATIAAFILNRFTKDGLTPSMGPKLERAGQRVFAEIPFETAPITQFTQVPPTDPEPEYVGEHRAPDAPTADGLADGEQARAAVEQSHRDTTGV